jgi:hypothetical protein
MGRVPALINEWLNAIQAQNTPTVCVVVYGNRVYDNALLDLKILLSNADVCPVPVQHILGSIHFQIQRHLQKDVPMKMI